MTEYKGFRFGVKEVIAEESASLLLFADLQLVELGAVYVNDVRSLNPERRISKGDRVRVHSSPRRYPIPVDLSQRIQSESGDWLVIDKPFGLPSEATVDNFQENLLRALEELRGTSLFLVNRLEADSSGLVLLAKSQKAFNDLKLRFAEGRLKRSFVAFTLAKPSLAAESKLSIRSCEELTGPTSILSEGRTSWILESPLERYFRIEVSTFGKPIDIRDLLAESGAAIIGDTRRGSEFILKDEVSGKSSVALTQVRFELQSE